MKFETAPDLVEDIETSRACYADWALIGRRLKRFGSVAKDALGLESQLSLGRGTCCAWAKMEMMTDQPASRNREGFYSATEVE